MLDDDGQVGSILTRREVLALLGASAGIAAVRALPAGLGAAVPGRTGWLRGGDGREPMQVPACVVRPAQTEGPYFVDEKLDRSDLRSDPSNGALSAGVALALEVRVSRVGSGACAPLSGVMVDLWQCDAAGLYSDVDDMNGLFNTRGRKFLRGFQRTGADGLARFTTIYPGWYQGRAVHIHFKVRTQAAGRAWEFTSQMYFEEALNDTVLARTPYSANKGARVRNEADGIFRQGGRQLMLDARPRGDGYAATFELGLNLP